ncbi:sodium-extruding oxaloacetate decarboxylase subunit alpha [bacterium]|nr:sodium-extruding oxaloacetate decarboxylase subunit alpha [bacterium]
MSNPLRITDLILRDAHQSLIATRMRTEHMLPAAELLDSQPYWSLEMWGGATFDSCIRFCGEDPWERLRQLRKALPNQKMQMLLRGQNILGYRHYADDIVDKFVERAVVNGIDVFRIFDALNDIRNLQQAFRSVKKYGGHAQGTLSYTTSPVHTLEFWRQMGKELAAMGADSICIKDMAGLLEPKNTRPLIRAIKEAGLPVQLHCHYTSGLASICYWEAIDEGVDGVDTDISSFSTGTAHPPTETIYSLVRGTDRDPGFDLKTLDKIAVHFREVRMKHYADFESAFSGVNPSVLVFQIPGGMISNLANQLKEQKALDRFEEVVAEVPRVREDYGYPPLVTPTSQIVGTQAVFNVLSGERYKMVTEESKNYLMGKYGKPPGEVNEEVRKKVIGDAEHITHRPADILEPEWDRLSEKYKDIAESEEDVLTLALFPQAGREFLEKRKAGTLAPVLPKKKEEPKPAPAAAPAAPAALETMSFRVTVNQRPYDVVVEPSGAPVAVNPAPPQQTQVPAPAAAPPPPPPAAAVAGAEINAPVLGKVLHLIKKVGDPVSEGEAVLVLEAMKMENDVVSPLNGKVLEILVSEGQEVNPGDVLAKVG